VDHQVLEVAHTGFLLQQAHGRAFDVKAAHGAPLGQQGLGGRHRLRVPIRAFFKVDAPFSRTLE
jgi:hypothetical protein